MLLEGIMADTPLGQIVSIRAENDPDMLKNFNAEQMRIHNAWQNKKAAEMLEENEEQYNNAMASFSSFFRSMAGSMAGGEG